MTQQKTLDEQREDWWAFYRNLYEKHGYAPKKSKRLGVTNDVCLKYGARKDLKRWLDVGAGGHRIKTPANVTELCRADPGHPEADFHVPIHELSKAFGEGSFDVVCCFDVLEHLIPEELEEGIEALWKVCRPGGRIIISVGTGPGGPWDGRDVHLTQEPAEWWKATLEEIFGVKADHVATAKKRSPFFVSDKPAT